MQQFRIYTIDNGGRIAGPPLVVSLKDDAEIESCLSQVPDSARLEVWCGDRLVRQAAPAAAVDAGRRRFPFLSRWAAAQ